MPMLRPASEMKDSGVDWIGKMPERWRVEKIKHLGSARNGLTYSPDDMTDETNGILVIRSSNIQNGKWDFHDNVYVRTDIPKELILKDGDIVICSRNGSRNLIGKNAIVEGDCNNTFGAFMMVYRPNINNKKYMYWILNSGMFGYYLPIFFTSTINQLTRANFSQMVFPYTTSESEQQAIADYLDDRCSKIDEIIAEATASIEEYRELKQAVIFEAVTKGLDKTVPMKDSGIEWIGEIPALWTYFKLRYVVDDIGDIDHYMPASVMNGIPYVMTGDLKNIASEIEFDSCKQVSHEDYVRLSKKISVNKGDVIFARYASIGVICYVDIDKDFLVSYSCVTIKPKHNLIDGWFLKYYLQSSAFKEEVMRYANSNVQANVGKESMYQAKIALPSMYEQKQIVNYLDNTIGKIDSLISEKQALIDDLQAYKKSLIYEVVTGKRRVV